MLKETTLGTCWTLQMTLWRSLKLKSEKTHPQTQRPQGCSLGFQINLMLMSSCPPTALCLSLFTFPVLSWIHALPHPTYRPFSDLLYIIDPSRFFAYFLGYSNLPSIKDTEYRIIWIQGTEKSDIKTSAGAALQPSCDYAGISFINLFPFAKQSQQLFHLGLCRCLFS